MSLAKTETFEISAGPVVTPPPPLAQARLARLGYGKDVTREDVERVCETESAANQFIDAARRKGWLVPVAWGRYRVPPRATLDAMARLQHPTFQQFVAWATTIRTHAGRRVAFAAPRIWRDTDLNVDHPMPVVLLKPEDQEVQGAPPQWAAFHMDADEPEPWELVVPAHRPIRVLGLARDDVIALLRASRDPRLAQGARQLERKRSLRPSVFGGKPRLETPREAPRGNRSLNIGLGPPHRRRLLAPPWYMETLRRSLSPAFGGDE